MLVALPAIIKVLHPAVKIPRAEMARGTYRHSDPQAAKWGSVSPPCPERRKPSDRQNLYGAFRNMQESADDGDARQRPRLPPVTFTISSILV